MPPRVKESHGSYFYDLGRDENGKRRSVKLCRVSDGLAAMHAALAAAVQPNPDTMGELLALYQAEGMDELSPRTRTDYGYYIRHMLEPQFGHVRVSKVAPYHIAQYLEWRKKNGAAVQGNRERACLSSAFEFGMRRGLAQFNPCRGIRRNKETPKSRYVRNEEFLAYFDASPDYVQDLMAVIYLGRMRPGEARALTRDQLKTEGIVWEESKTGRINICRWSDPLRFFVRRACERQPEADRVLTNSRGRPWTPSGMNSAIRRARASADVARWTWHDLRAKGESDAAESAGLMALYNRAKEREAVR